MARTRITTQFFKLTYIIFTLSLSMAAFSACFTDDPEERTNQADPKSPYFDPPEKTYRISGAVYFQTGDLAIELNGSDPVTIPYSELPAGQGAGFIFSDFLKDGAAYQVSVSSQPPGQSCRVSGGANGDGTGKIKSASVNSIEIFCEDNSYSVGGTVNGLVTPLAETNALEVTLNGVYTSTITDNGLFSLEQRLDYLEPYKVEITNLPPGQSCDITAGDGTISESDVNSIVINCYDNPFYISGTVSGMPAASSLTLQLNGGTGLDVFADGSFNFSQSLSDGDSYNVTVLSNPLSYSCSVTGGSGSIASADVSDVVVNCSENTYTVAVSAGGVLGTLVLQNNGGDNLVITSDGVHQFAGTLADGAAWNVSILSEPNGQSCAVSSGSTTGTISGSNAVGPTILCGNLTYTIGGNVTNLNGSITLQLNGGSNKTLNGSTPATPEPFTFDATPLENGQAYSVTVLTHPAEYTCAVSGGSATVPGADVNSVSVNCVLNTYTVSVDVNNLAGSLYLQNNGSDTTDEITANGTVSFDTALPAGSAYAVSIQSQPPGQTCSISGGANGDGSGSMPSADLTTVHADAISINCVYKTYSIGGSISGIPAGKKATLLLNGGGDLELTADGSFTFGGSVNNGGSYTVTVASNALKTDFDYDCTISGGSGGDGSGTVSAANVTDINVSCRVMTYYIDVTASGLGGSLVVQNSGGDDLAFSNNGTKRFATELTDGTLYDITVLTEPLGQSCTVAGGSGGDGTGTINKDNVTGASAVTVSCSDILYNIGGMISGIGIAADGIDAILQLNGGNDLSLDTDGSFTFSNTLVNSDSYSVTLLSAGSDYDCTVANASGSILLADIDDINVACSQNTYSVTVNVNSLAGSLVLQNNGSDTTEITTNGNHTFFSELTEGSAYGVTIYSQPAGQTCSVTNGSGNINNFGDVPGPADVSDVSITCVNKTYSISGTVANTAGDITLRLNGGDPQPITTASTAFAFTTQVANTGGYTVTADTVSNDYSCTLTGGSNGDGSGTVAAADVSNIHVDCSQNTYTIGYTVTSLAGSLSLRLNGGEIKEETADGSYSFNTTLVKDDSYTVAVYSQPAGQTCSVTNGSGTVATADITNISINCTNQTYTIGGTILGLDANSANATLQLNGGSDLALSADGSFTFGSQVANTGSYTVSVLDTSGNDITCQVTNGSGTVAAANVTDVAVSCSVNTYTVGGTVSGLIGSLSLQNNGGDGLVKTSNGSYTFSTGLMQGAAYAVTITSAPPGQTCTISGGGNGDGTGNILDWPANTPSNITNVDINCVTKTYTVSGNISGIPGGESVSLQLNGGALLAVNADGPFTFTNQVLNGDPYTVSTASATADQACTVTGGDNGDGTGTINAANVTGISVNCVINTYFIEVSTSGLSGSLVLQNNGGDDLAISANGTRRFGTELVNGAAYNISILTGPAGQSCSVTGGSGADGTGTINKDDTEGGDVTNTTVITVSCNDIPYTVGGTISGVAAASDGINTTLQLNGGSDLVVDVDGSFTFGTTLVNTDSYTVSVSSVSADYTCTVGNGTGSILLANISNVTVDCIENTYSIGYNVNSLSGSLVLQNNATDTTEVTVNGNGTFAAELTAGSAYAVTFLTQPTGQTCTISGGGNGDGSGSINAFGASPADITGINITCADKTYTVGGTISGIPATQQVTLINGGDELALNVDGSFTFGTALAHTTGYTVTVSSDPVKTDFDHACTVTGGTNGDGSGSINAANVTDINVSCDYQQYTVGGTVNSLSGSIVLQNNGSDNLIISASGGFTFGDTLIAGDAYVVTIYSQPNGQTCTVSGGGNGDGSGNINAFGATPSNIGNVSVDCVDKTYNIGGTISGVPASKQVTLLVNGGDDLVLSADGGFTFTTALAHTTNYTVSVASDPAKTDFDYDCTISNDTGTVNAADVNNVFVSCQYKEYTLTWSGSNLADGLGVQLNNDEVSELTADGSKTFTTKLVDGASYSVAVFSPPVGQTCAVTNGSGTINKANVTDISVNCTAINYTIGGTVSGIGASGTSTNLKLNGELPGLDISADGSFTFAGGLTNGTAYSVTATGDATTDYTCDVNNASGSILAANVTDVEVICYPIDHSISYTISGLDGTLLLDLAVNSTSLENKYETALGGPFAFSTKVNKDDTYAVTVTSQPDGQVCSLTGGSNGDGTGTVASSNISITVSCADIQYTVGGTLTGIGGSGGTGGAISVDLQLNGANDITLDGDGSFTFGTTLVNLDSYSVTTLPVDGQYQDGISLEWYTCTVNFGSGTITTESITDVSVVCSVNSFDISYTVSGLDGSVIVENNGIDTSEISANGFYTFDTPVADTAAYEVTVLSEPANQDCIITNGTGMVANADITDVVINCAYAFTVGGGITGLSGSVTLQLNGANDLVLTDNGSFIFGTTLPNSTSYNITVSSQPAGQTCSITGGSSTISLADVTNVAVACGSPGNTMGGTVTNLFGTVDLELVDTDTETVLDLASLSADGAYSFSVTPPGGTNYRVDVVSEPAAQKCVISGGSNTDGSGTVSGSVGDLNVDCQAGYTVTLNVSGIREDVIIENLIGGTTTDSMVVSADGSHTFSEKLYDSTSYAVTVPTSGNSSYINCAVSGGNGGGDDGSGTTATANVTITVACNANDIYSLTLRDYNDDLNPIFLPTSGAGEVNNYDLGNWGFTTSSITLNVTPFDSSASVELCVYMSNSTCGAGAFSITAGEDITVALTADDASGTALDNVIEVIVTNSTTRTYSITIQRDILANIIESSVIRGSNTEFPDKFGFSANTTSGPANPVGVHEDLLIVGSPWENGGTTSIIHSSTNPTAAGDDDANADAGAAYIFRKSAGTWVQEAYLKPSYIDALDFFGTAVDIYKDDTMEVAIVGAYDESSTDPDDPSNNSSFTSGAAYIFRRCLSVSGCDSDGDAVPDIAQYDWYQEAYLKSQSIQENDALGGYGSYVAIYGNIAVVGSPTEDIVTTRVGAVYVYHYNDGSWEYIQKIYPDVVTLSDMFFGGAFALENDVLAVGSRGEDSNATGINGDQNNTLSAGSGAVYAYKFNGTTNQFEKEAYIKADAVVNYGGFGHSLDLYNNVLTVGAPCTAGACSYQAVYIYQRDKDTGTWSFKDKVTDTSNEYFGWGVSIWGHTFTTGQIFNTKGGNSLTGGFHIYPLNSDLTIGTGSGLKELTVVGDNYYAGMCPRIWQDEIFINNSDDSGGGLYIFK